MPDLKKVYEFSQDEVFRSLTMKSRPVTINVRTLEGTKERLDKLSAAGFGSSRSEAAHLCLQIGLLAFEGRFDEIEES